MLYEAEDAVLPALDLTSPTTIHIDDSYDDKYLKLDVGPRYWIFHKESGCLVEARTRLAPGMDKVKAGW